MQQNINGLTLKPLTHFSSSTGGSKQTRIICYFKTKIKRIMIMMQKASKAVRPGLQTVQQLPTKGWLYYEEGHKHDCLNF